MLEGDADAMRLLPLWRPVTSTAELATALQSIRTQHQKRSADILGELFSFFCCSLLLSWQLPYSQPRGSTRGDQNFLSFLGFIEAIAVYGGTKATAARGVDV